MLLDGTEGCGEAGSHGTRKGLFIVSSDELLFKHFTLGPVVGLKDQPDLQTGGEQWIQESDSQGDRLSFAIIVYNSAHQATEKSGWWP